MLGALGLACKPYARVDADLVLEFRVLSRRITEHMAAAAAAQPERELDSLVEKHKSAISQLQVAMDFVIDVAPRFEADKNPEKVCNKAAFPF